jgi:DNA-directed RNA polymerase subunit K/omega
LIPDMEEPSPLQQDPDTPKVPAEPLPPIQSRFLFVDVAALRAKQLRRGARPRLGEDVPAPHKAERVAMEEVKRGLVLYDVVPVVRVEDAGDNGMDAG